MTRLAVASLAMLLVLIAGLVSLTVAACYDWTRPSDPNYPPYPPPVWASASASASARGGAR